MRPLFPTPFVTQNQAFLRHVLQFPRTAAIIRTIASDHSGGFRLQFIATAALDDGSTLDFLCAVDDARLLPPPPPPPEDWDDDTTAPRPDDDDVVSLIRTDDGTDTEWLGTSQLGSSQQTGSSQHGTLGSTADHDDPNATRAAAASATAAASSSDSPWRTTESNATPAPPGGPNDPVFPPRLR